MKRTICALLCLALGCGLLAGCGGKPKIPPENFPHSETLRLDATEEEMLAIEDVKPHVLVDHVVEGYYDRTEPAVVDGIEFKLSFWCFDSDNLLGHYMTSRDDQDFSAEYQQLDKYFTKIYGEGGEVPPRDPITGPDPFNTLDEKRWFYTLDNGQEYAITLTHESSLEEVEGHPQYHLAISVFNAVWQ